MKLLTPLLLFLTGVALPACADMSAGFAPCTDSHDCPPGWTCNLSTYYCEESKSFDSIIDLELEPEQGTNSAITQIASLDLRQAPADVQIELNKAVDFNGWVTNFGLGVSGSILATRDPEFDGRSLSWNFQVESDGTFDSALGYKKEVSDNINTYQVLFRPSNRDDFPQLRYAKLVLPANGQSELNLSYPDYRDGGDGRQVTVQILQSENYPHPVTGMVVEGTTDAGLRTNLGVPDGQGQVVLKLPVVRSASGEDDIQPTTLTLVIRPEDNSIRMPTVQVKNIELGEPDLGVFYVGDVPDSQIVSGVVVTKSGQPVPDCQLRFAAEGIGNGSFEKIIKADLEGNFSTTLPEGNYRILTVPSPFDPVALGSKWVLVESGMGPVTVELDPPLKISGRVVDPDGQPVASAFLVAERTADALGLNDGVSRSFEVIAGPEGFFELDVDKGYYQLTFVPPPASGLPRRLLKNFALIDGDLELPREQTRLPEPEIIEGHVFNHLGIPMCAVGLEVFHSDETTATLIGQTVTASDPQGGCSGAFTVVVPAAD